MRRTFLAVALCSCATYSPRPAAAPLSPKELASHELSFADDTGNLALAGAFAQSLAADGFRLVRHAPRRGELEVRLRLAGRTAVATLTSDDFFVAEARAKPDPAVDAAAGLAYSLAVSQGMADFVRNNGTASQTGMSAP